MISFVFANNQEHSCDLVSSVTTTSLKCQLFSYLFV